MSISISTIRGSSANQVEPFTYKIFRFFSIYLTYILIRLNFNRPNIITLCWILCLLISAIEFSKGSFKNLLLGVFFIILHFVLDCVDGEIARATGRTSRIGSIIEQVGHWITNLSLIVGISLGLFLDQKDPNILILGMLCLAGDASFHFIFLQLNYWTSKNINYGYLHPITKFLYNLMPININIFLIGALLDHLHLSLIVWTFLSLSVFVIISLIFIRKELTLIK